MDRFRRALIFVLMLNIITVVKVLAFGHDAKHVHGFDEFVDFMFLIAMLLWAAFAPRTRA